MQSNEEIDLKILKYLVPRNSKAFGENTSRLRKTTV